MTAIFPYLSLSFFLSVCFFASGLKCKGKSQLIVFGQATVIIGLCFIAYTGKYTPGDFDTMSYYMDMARSGNSTPLIDSYISNPLSAVLLLAVSRIGDYKVLRIIAVIFSYGLSLYSINKLSESKMYIHKTQLFLSLIILSFFPFWNITDNIRYPMASGIFIAGFLRFFYSDNHRWIDYLLILISPLIHAGMWICAFIFFASFFNKFTKILFPLLLFAQVILLPFMTFISPLLPSDLQDSLIVKSDSYLIQGSQYHQWINTQLYLLSLLLLIFEVWTIVSSRNLYRHRTIPRRDKSSYRFILLFTCFLVGSLINTQFIRRYGLYGFPCFFPLVAGILERQTTDKSIGVQKFYLYSVWLAALLIGYAIYNLQSLLSIWW